MYDYWGQSCCENIIPLPLELFGWKVEDKCISVEWDSPENMMAVRKKVAFLTQVVVARRAANQYDVNV